MEDVIIIGGGVCGCSLLYALSRYALRVTLVEKENDVSTGTSKANSGIIHAGYDPEPGTLMAKYNVEGNPLIYALCETLDVVHKKTGSLVVGFNDRDRAVIQGLYERGIANQVPGLRIVEYGELHRMEPHLSKDCVCALYAETGGVVSPWEFASAQAEAAVQGGARVRLDTEVTGIRKEGGNFVLATGRGEMESRFVVNAAGVCSDLVSRMVEPEFFTIHHKRGQYFLMDTASSYLVNSVIFQCPNENGKGVIVGPTAHGNLIAGPDNERVRGDDRTNTAAGMDFVRKMALRSVPDLNFSQSIRNFSGVRADSTLNDFLVGPSERVPGFFNIAGIKSPGLSSSPAIAQDVTRMLGEAGLKLEKNPRFTAGRRVKRFKYMSVEERRKAAAEDPLYGAVICRCETVTEGEIVDAFKRPLPPRSLDAVKRRCGAGMGRCQGGFCGPRVLEIAARELSKIRDVPVRPGGIPLDREGMYIITGETKTPEGKGE
ncbi:MAG: NAD(P)/FAD-dependent oxidoreductase [Treponema sp.]|jgi:glycerol-3-phosphate dehydrogenase|nr:NAD(P)/FAD-dependent oxidoreductase [Treponema sp.]